MPDFSGYLGVGLFPMLKQGENAYDLDYKLNKKLN